MIKTVKVVGYKSAKGNIFCVNCGRRFKVKEVIIERDKFIFENCSHCVQPLGRAVEYKEEGDK